jgi:adenylate cyclase class 2
MFAGGDYAIELRGWQLLNRAALVEAAAIRRRYTRRMPRATNREIEVKLSVEDIQAVVNKLKTIGAVSYGSVFERNMLYDTADSDLRRSGRLLRIRVETPAPSEWARAGRGKTVVTAKAPSESGAKSQYKERLEREVVISNPKGWEGNLRALGFKPGFVYEKFRSSFRFPRQHRDLHLDLDETPAGAFLELEGSPKSIDGIAKVLGYSSRDYFRGTYWDVYATDCRKRGVSPKNMVFVRKKISK